jgi:hydroxyacylglutathione hydrolase
MLDSSNHSRMTRALQIIPIPAFQDNYIWLIAQGEAAIVVDPGDAAPVLAALKKYQIHLSTLLITHHHGDHIDGVETLLQHFPNARVYAPKLEQYAFTHTAVSEGDQIKALDLTFNVLEVPGHTLGHVAYYAQNSLAPLLFCGDTLFGAGCGRLFEGTPAQMLASLKKMSQFPPETNVFCTHEYTLKNIAFALSLEPNNQALIVRKNETERLLAAQQPSLPSTIALEIATNPFLRCNDEAIKLSVNLPTASELSVFTKIRHLRNTY